MTSPNYAKVRVEHTDPGRMRMTFDWLNGDAYFDWTDVAPAEGTYYFIPEADLPRWIPVEERLPDEDEWVLAVCGKGEAFEAVRIDCGPDGLQWDAHPECFLNGEITHWMPFPFPPKEPPCPS